MTTPPADVLNTGNETAVRQYREYAAIAAELRDVCAGKYTWAELQQRADMFAQAAADSLTHRWPTVDTDAMVHATPDTPHGPLGGAHAQPPELGETQLVHRVQ